MAPCQSRNVINDQKSSILLNAIFKAKCGKACGIDDIPSEVLRNDTAIYFLHVLFNLCFENSIIKKGLIGEGYHFLFIDSVGLTVILNRTI